MIDTQMNRLVEAVNDVFGDPIRQANVVEGLCRIADQIGRLADAVEKLKPVGTTVTTEESAG